MNSQEKPFDIREAALGFGYTSTKTYAHSVGLSCCFRQWRAESHCHLLHGYSIRVHFEFSSTQLDVRNWVVDFGSLKPLKGWLEGMFDHKTLVAEDDPELTLFEMMHRRGMVELRMVPSTGCEAMARMIYEYASQWLKDAGYGHVVLAQVEVAEHEGNSARYGIIPPSESEVQRIADQSATRISSTAIAKDRASGRRPYTKG